MNQLAVLSGTGLGDVQRIGSYCENLKFVEHRTFGAPMCQARSQVDYGIDMIINHRRSMDLSAQNMPNHKTQKPTETAWEMTRKESQVRDPGLEMWSKYSSRLC